MKTKRKFRLMPDGNTTGEYLYALFRHHCGVIAKRVREKPRCRHCFTHCWRGGDWHIKCGCDGCAEMESFIEKARDAFAREADETNGEGAKG